MSSLTQRLQRQRPLVHKSLAAWCFPQQQQQQADPILMHHRIVCPRQVAERLEWNAHDGHLLTVMVTTTESNSTAFHDYQPPRPPPPSRLQLEWAMVRHPRYYGSNGNIIRLPSVPLWYEPNHGGGSGGGGRRRSLADTTVASLRNILRQQHGSDIICCGWVVDWPLTKRHGTCGAQCGKVLYALEAVCRSLSYQASGPVVAATSTVPLLCLYPTTTSTTMTSISSPAPRGKEDEWGRSVLYGTPPPPDTTVHVASVEQYDMTAMMTNQHDQRRKCVVRDVWGSFARQHWPHHAESAAVDVATLTTSTTLDEKDEDEHDKVGVAAAVATAAQITKDDDDIVLLPSRRHCSTGPSSSPPTTTITANIPRHSYRPSASGARLPAPRQHAKLSSTSSNNNSNLLHFVP